MEIRPSLLPAYYTLVDACRIRLLLLERIRIQLEIKGDGDVAIIVALQPNTINVPIAVLFANTGVRLNDRIFYLIISG
jgi:hypothetical protein